MSIRVLCPLLFCSNRSLLRLCFLPLTFFSRGCAGFATELHLQPPVQHAHMQAATSSDTARTPRRDDAGTSAGAAGRQRAGDAAAAPGSACQAAVPGDAAYQRSRLAGMRVLCSACSLACRLAYLLGCCARPAVRAVLRGVPPGSMGCRGGAASARGPTANALLLTGSLETGPLSVNLASCLCLLLSVYGVQVVAVVGCTRHVTLQLKILTWPALVRRCLLPVLALVCWLFF